MFSFQLGGREHPKRENNPDSKNKSHKLILKFRTLLPEKKQFFYFRRMEACPTQFPAKHCSSNKTWYFQTTNRKLLQKLEK